MVEKCVGIDYLTEYVTGALIGGEVIEEAIEECLRDACLLGSASPVEDVMASAKSGMGTTVVAVNLSIMSAHSHCHTPGNRTAGAQELIPEHGGSAEFGVVPSVAAYIVAPFATAGVVRVHDIAVVEVAIP